MRDRSSRTMRGLIVAIVCILLCIAMVFGFAACGSNVQSPYIGDNGNWYVDGKDTNVPATGPAGPQGEKGDKGEDGKDFVGSVDGGDGEELPAIVEGKAEKVTPDGGLSEGSKYYPSYSTFEEVREAGKNVNIELASEGFTLLKNADNALPLTAKETNVSLLGYKSYSLQLGGGGSGSGRPGIYGVPTATLTQSLADAGFKVNPKLVDFYAGVSSEIDATDFPAAVTGTCEGYKDAAIVTIARSGAEGSDHKTSGQDVNKDKHALELTDAEQSLIKYAKAHFNKVIVLINSANIMEVGALNEEKTDSNLGVDAIMWIGHTGNDGAAAIGPILNGTVNPSGHTVDIWASDFTKGPTFTNFGDMSQNKNADGTPMDNKLYIDGTPVEAGQGLPSGFSGSYHSVEYREGIYMGYRYYETVAEDMDAASAGSGEKWYSENVVYPFGYGLSYTTFEWELADVAETAQIKAADDTVTMRVKVTNTGAVAGKDVVQVYYTAPYTKGGIEKASTNLVGFAKTDMLEPGESDIVTVKFVAQDMASFDWNDKNDNDFSGYELEKGDYVISICRDSHEVVDSVVRTISSDIQCTTDYQTGKTIKTLFTGEVEGLERYKSTNDALEANLISRENGLTQPAASTIEDRTITDADLQLYDSESVYYSCQDLEDDVWYVSDTPASWDQGKGVKGNDGMYELTLKDMVGVSYTEPTIVDGTVQLATDADSQKWEEFMNQLTWEEMASIIPDGMYGMRNTLPSIGKEGQFGGDGPTQLGWNANMIRGYGDGAYDMGTNWVVAPITAATWNVELCAKQGAIIGDEALFLGINEWEGPGMNTHRSPFSGRNFEYYSEDGVQGAKIAVAVTKAASDKGLVCNMKHMFLNDQETNRNTSGGVFTWADEQTMREIYLKPFEACVKDADCKGAMTAFNRIGDAVTSTNYALLECLFRQEWGFRGRFVTDYQDYKEYRYLNLMCRVGQEMPMGGTIASADGKMMGDASSVEGTWDATKKMVLVAANEEDAARCEELRQAADTYMIHTNGAPQSAELKTLETVESPTHYFAVRKVAQRLLYTYVNSNAMKNALGKAALAEDTFETKTLSSVNIALSVDKETVGASDVSFRLAGDSKLPEGLSMNASGVISGSPVTSGNYTIDIEVVSDNWVVDTDELTINVASSLSYSGSNIVCNAIEDGKINGNTVESVTFTATGAGVTVSPDGTVTGSAGTHTIEVTANIVAYRSGWGGSKTYYNYTTTEVLEITIA